MIISDLSVFEVVEESAHIQGGDSFFLPVFTGANGTPVNPSNTSTATAGADAVNPFGPGSGKIIGVSVSSTLAQTSATAVLGGGSSARSTSAASISFVPGPNGAPLLINDPLTITNP